MNNYSYVGGKEMNHIHNKHEQCERHHRRAPRVSSQVHIHKHQHHEAAIEKFMQVSTATNQRIYILEKLPKIQCIDGICRILRSSRQ